VTWKAAIRWALHYRWAHPGHRHRVYAVPYWGGWTWEIECIRPDTDGDTP